MFTIIIGFISILCAWKWGDWKNYRFYLPTIQFFIMGDMLYNLFTWNYHLWSYPHPPNLLPNHLLTNLFIMFAIYPSTMLIFLYRFPNENLLKRLFYIFIWIVLWLSFELVMVLNGLCVYSHGWTYGCSIVFACIMVPILILHHKRPMWAYLVSVPITVFLLLWFHVPVLNDK
ncbi:CBO0543 family protein [Neobacillus sp. NRS-1170]|uniref:CBO0543 family protein n=1 Tax=Neobacillus sp. NRS-1170 TaxID=3233898 RepID=UPI003D29893A